MIFWTEHRIKEVAKKAGSSVRMKALYPGAFTAWNKQGKKIKELFPG
jgi:hypothetical protein